MHTYLISWDISFYRMQQRQADAINRKVAFLDPFTICEARHYRPMLWKDDHDELSMCSTRKAKLDKQKKAHKDIARIVGAYISLQMQQWQDSDITWAPYQSVVCYNTHLLRVNA